MYNIHKKKVAIQNLYWLQTGPILLKNQNYLMIFLQLDT